MLAIWNPVLAWSNANQRGTETTNSMKATPNATSFARSSDTSRVANIPARGKKIRKCSTQSA